MKIYTKTLQNPYLKKNLEEHFPQPPQKGVCSEIFTTKETCPPS